MTSSSHWEQTFQTTNWPQPPQMTVNNGIKPSVSDPALVHANQLKRATGQTSVRQNRASVQSMTNESTSNHVVTNKVITTNTVQSRSAAPPPVSTGQAETKIVQAKTKTE